MIIEAFVMKRFHLLWLIMSLFLIRGISQTFDYDIHLEPLSIPDMPGIHSFVIGQHDGKWLILGGRKDGLHPRQPFDDFYDYNAKQSHPIKPFDKIYILPLQMDDNIVTHIKYFNGRGIESGYWPISWIEQGSDMI